MNMIDWDDDNDATDDPDEWEEDEFWDDGEHVDTCPWCGSTTCSFLNQDGQLECCATKRMIP